MIHQTAEQLLNDVLLKYGVAACDTPNMLETFLRKHGRACPQEVEVLSAALRCGVVTQLRSEKNTDRASLARLMVLDTRLPQAQAEWVVAAWSAALARAPARVATGPTAADQAGSGSLMRSVFVLTCAAATGAIAYLTFAP